jgi:hypothetical protein
MVFKLGKISYASPTISTGSSAKAKAIPRPAAMIG